MTVLNIYIEKHNCLFTPKNLLQFEAIVTGEFPSTGFTFDGLHGHQKIRGPNLPVQLCYTF